MAVSANENPRNEKFTLFVKNLPEDATKEQLDLVFSEVGKVRHCFVVKNRRTAQSKGIGFVTFTNNEDVQSALGKSFKLGKNELNVSEAKKKQANSFKQTDQARISFSKDAKKARQLQKSRIIVRNLSFKATEEDLKDRFGKYGEILSINIPKKPDGKMRGFAFVQFKTTPDATKAVKELNMKDIKGRTVAVDFTVAKKKFDQAQKLTAENPQQESLNNESSEEDEESSSEEETSDASVKRRNKKESTLKKKQLQDKANAEVVDMSVDEPTVESTEESDDDDDDDDENEEDVVSNRFEKQHQQKRLKKSNKNTGEIAESDGESDSEVEFGSDGEVRLVMRDQVKDKKKILKKKTSKNVSDQQQQDDCSSSDDDDEAMDVDKDDTDIQDKSDDEETAAKNKKASKGSKEDSDSDWGHTPSEGSSDDEDEDGDAEKAKRRAEMIKKEDLNRTVFISNISFETTQKTLQEHLKKYGPYKFCLLCMDKVLNRSRGTAFVKFEEKRDAEKCISSLTAGELTLDGKVLTASSAMKRDQLKQEMDKKAESKKQPKDNRNLFLAREGFIRGGTAVAADVSDHDLKLRAKLEANKKKALKNLHNFVSLTRLCVHNLPSSCDDKQLRKIFAKGVDRSAKITEARVMLNMKRLGPDGKGISKGFGFVNFEKHEDALKALRYVNNNPEIFTDQMRPVVSFSIESKAALLVKERRLQRSRDKLKELRQTKNAPSDVKEHRNVDYGKGERSAFEGLRAQTDMKTLPQRVGEKIRADPSRRNHQMRLKRLAKKARKQPEFKKKRREKKTRAPTKSQLKEKRQDKPINDLIEKRRRNLKKQLK